MPPLQNVKQNSPDMPIMIIRPGLVTIATGSISNTIAPSSTETTALISIMGDSTTHVGDMTMATPTTEAMVDIAEGDNNQYNIKEKGPLALFLRYNLKM